MKKILIIYTTVFILFCLFTFLFIDPNFTYLKSLYSGFAINNRQITTAIFFIFITIMFGLYFKILNFKNLINFKNFTNYKFLFLIPIAGILAYPAALSFDLFNYIATAKVTFGYFENPYVVMPIDLIGEPILVFTRAANKVALYGPLWIGFTSIPYYLSFGSYLLSIVLFKAFVSVFWVGIVYLLWKISKSTYAVLYFMASPLILIETFVGGHNDVVMMFFALLSIYLLKNKKILLAVVFLLASILIKYATLFLIPVFLYYIFMNNKKRDIDWNFIYRLCFGFMILIFLLSPIREEIYPWYAIWPLTFLSLIASKHKILSNFFIFFSFCLMLRYIPYMFSGTYFGTTPIINLIITFFLPVIFLIFLFSKYKFKINK